MARAPTGTTAARGRRRATGANAPANPPPAAPSLVPATLRLYCHGLGDCMLVSLPADHADRPFRILIDCGVHSAVRAGPRRVDAVLTDLARACDRHLDVIVGTHEHWDHLSGFLTARDRFVDAVAPGLAADDPRIRVGEIWLAWTENPEDPEARALDRYKDEAEATLLGLRLAIESADDVGGMGLDATAAGLDSLFGFVFGARGERVRSAREALRTLVPESRVRYLEPGTLAPLPSQVTGFRAHVLGPPRDARLLRIHDSPTDGYKLAFGNHPETLALASALAIANGHLDLRDDPAAPFDPTEGVSLADLRDGRLGDGAGSLRAFLDAHYLGADANRRIEGIWLAGAAELALQLDRNTNNTSLVLALER
ncbi:MAG: MBL fold metallo-hydrolase, partial [Thermaurantiacus sp.]